MLEARILRIRRGETLADVGRAVGVSGSVLARWETENCNLGQENLVALAAYYGVSIDELLLKADAPTEKATA